MIATFITAVEGYFISQLPAGKLLQGVASVHVGPVEPESIPDQQFPALVINVTPVVASFPRGDSQAAMEGELHLQLYTVSMAAYRDAVLQAWRLYLSDDKTQGLIRAVALQRGYMFNGNVDGFVLLPGSAQMAYGARSKKGFTIGINLSCKLSGRLSAV